MPFRRRSAPRNNSEGASQHFEVLYEEYFHRIYAYIASRFENAQEAEDVVSDIFLKVMQRLPQFRGENLSAWLFTIAHNTLQDTYRRPRVEVVGLEDDIIAEMHSPEQSYLTHENATEMLQHIRSLSARRQEVITLKFYGQLRNQEIAEVLGINEQSVASHIHRALSDLRARMVPVIPPQGEET